MPMLPKMHINIVTKACSTVGHINVVGIGSFDYGSSIVLPGPTLFLLNQPCGTSSA